MWIISRVTLLNSCLWTPIYHFLLQCVYSDLCGSCNVLVEDCYVAITSLPYFRHIAHFQSVNLFPVLASLPIFGSDCCSLLTKWWWTYYCPHPATYLAQLRSNSLMACHTLLEEYRSFLEHKLELPLEWDLCHRPCCSCCWGRRHCRWVNARHCSTKVSNHFLLLWCWFLVFVSLPCLSSSHPCNQNPGCPWTLVCCDWTSLDPRYHYLKGRNFPTNSNVIVSP